MRHEEMRHEEMRHEARRAPSALVQEILRVDHAGEMAAVEIYRAQRRILPQLPHVEEMLRQEEEHLKYFAEEMGKSGVRPTVLLGVWRGAATVLGTLTAVMGEASALACTQAVEEVIEAHYARQSRALRAAHEAEELQRVLVRFREEEQAHKVQAEGSGRRRLLGMGC